VEHNKTAVSNAFPIIHDEHITLFQNPFVGIIILDGEKYEIVSVNDRACEILGRCGESSHSIHAFLEDAGMIDHFKKNLKETNQDINIEVNTARIAGDDRWIRMNGSSKPPTDYIRILLMDVTEERKNCLELQLLHNHFEQFIYHASHNLRSPLTSLLGLLQLTKFNLGCSETVGSYIGLMTERIEYMDRLLLDLIAVANNENAPIELSSINVRQKVQSILDEYTFQDQTVQFTITGNQTRQFVSDAARLRIILRQILSNSFKFRNPVIEIPRVEVFFEIGDDSTLITVEDNGIGIPLQFQKKIFNIFFKATSNHAGSGLGLYVVRKMVDKLGGDIKVKSTLYKGSIFSITLPNRRLEVLTTSLR
jgi:signal transduction histidine kinase